MDVVEVMDLYQELLDILEEVGKEHPKSAATQALVSKGAFAGSRGMKKLTMLLLYKDTSEGTNGDEPKEVRANQAAQNGVQNRDDGPSV